MNDLPHASGALAGTVLLVDDDAETTNTVSELLAREGYRVMRAANGRMALNALEDGDYPDLIVCDLMMPVMSGWEFAEALKAKAELRNIPLIAWSGSDFHDDGVGTAFLRKPINPGKLLRVVRDTIKQKT